MAMPAMIWTRWPAATWSGAASPSSTGIRPFVSGTHRPQADVPLAATSAR